ncbi:MAG: dipeptidase [Candidatus Marinimicrobia bacterium]|nr:dipeptidase [Candidatus Neomarinimicrobiota bacterium]
MKSTLRSHYLLTGALLLTLIGGHLRAQNSANLATARQILKETPLIDGHNDVPWQYLSRAKNHMDEIRFDVSTAALEPPMHSDIPRLKKGGLGAQFWSVYIPATSAGPGAVREVYTQIDVVHRLVARYPRQFEMAYTADDIVRIHKQGKIGSLIGIEGGHAIENSLAVLRELYRSGARYMTLTHSKNIDWADSATEIPVHNGLTPFGKLVIREMNRLGMLVDLSHTSEKTMSDVLDMAQSPVIFSHSSARAVTGHPRNVPDAILKRLKKNGGIVMVTFVTPFINDDVRGYYLDLQVQQQRAKSQNPYDTTAFNRQMESWKTAHPMPRASLADVAAHIDHIAKLIGVNHIGIGSDFDGIESVPEGLEDVSTFPALFAELMSRGYSRKDLKKIAGENMLRVMRANEKTAARLQRSDRPLDDLIDEIDEKKTP